MRAGSGGGGQTSEGEAGRDGLEKRPPAQPVRTRSNSKKQVFTSSEKALHAEEEHVFLTLFIVQEQFVFVIVAGIKGQFA
jgi:hypothetical protein